MVSLSVFIDCADLACTRTRLDERADSQATGVLHEQLFVRHWDSWKDGRRLQLFVARLAPESEPWSTNLGLWSVSASGEATPENLTADNAATDTTPVFSPDGSHLAWVAMSRPGFESDRYRIMLRDLRSGTTREVAPD